MVCCVGTTEPWNVAGLGLDIRALAACEARALTVVAGVSAQDALGIRAARAVPADLIAAQFAALERAPIAAFRVGALLDADSVRCVAAALAARQAAHGAVPVVYDPVVAASAGGTFADAATLAAIVRDLLPLAAVVTPNLAEAAVLLGVDARGATVELLARWARELVARGARSALVTGGHLAGDPVDVLVDAAGEARFGGARLPGDLRGTGCLLACALAAGLARGEPLRDAVAAARAFVRARFAAALDIGGMRGAY
ncbi:MAG: bifunctional hydroxymethylpyrimidine kinase/phosphomethylpyrimidine kinase [Vulcanimicrobiaceae bacterium]